MSELASIATRCSSAAEFRSEALAWLARQIDFDAANLVKLQDGSATVRHTYGLDGSWVDRFHQTIAGYRSDLASLVTTSLAMGGSAFGEWSHLEKWAALPKREGFEEGMAFPVGIRIGTPVVMTVRGQPTGVLFLARTGKQRRLFTQEEAEFLSSAAPVLTLGEALHERPPASLPPMPVKAPLMRPRRGLTPREQAVVEYVVLGLTNHQIALALGSSRLTVRNQLASIFQKLAVGSRTELAAVALHEGLVDPSAASRKSG